MQVSALILLCLLSVCGAFAQASDDSLTFEVASVKPHPLVAGEPAGSSFNGGPGTSDPGQITVINRTLRTLVIEAYGIRGFQIEHPQWVGDERFDIIAKVPPGTTPPQAKAMMRNLLVERFDLRIRRETRGLPVYALVVAKGGLKMKPSADDPAGQPPAPAEGLIALDKLKTGSDGFRQLPPGAHTVMASYTADTAKVTGQKQPLSQLVSWLSSRVSDRPIIDETGLKGNYDFSMTWSLEYDGAGNDFGLFAALEQQLGLKMDPRKMPTEMLIVVSALRVPKEN